MASIGRNAHHDVAVADQDGNLVAKHSIDDPTGFVDFLTMLADIGNHDQDPVPVAIETPRDLLIAALRSTELLMYAINLMAVARYRERAAPTRSKSDHADAMALATIGNPPTALSHFGNPIDREATHSLADKIAGADPTQHLGSPISAQTEGIRWPSATRNPVDRLGTNLDQVIAVWGGNKPAAR